MSRFGSMTPNFLKNAAKTPLGIGEDNAYAKEGNLDLRATGRMLYNEKLSNPIVKEPQEMMLLTFLGNGDEWVLFDKYSSPIDATNTEDYANLKNGFQKSTVVLDQYGTHSKPFAIPAAIAQTTLVTNTDNGKKIRRIIKGLYKSEEDAAGETSSKRTDGGKRRSTEKGKSKRFRRTVKSLPM